MLKNPKKRYYQYNVHCSFVFNNPYEFKDLAEEEIDVHFNELKVDIEEKLLFNHQFFDLELTEGNGNSNSDNASNEDSITCSFDFQEVFVRKEVMRVSAGLYSPTVDALSEVENELRKLFNYDYKPTSLIVFADYDDLMGIHDDEN